MTNHRLVCALSVVAITIGGFVHADDPATVKTHLLTVEEKLKLVETIEITSAKELVDQSEIAEDAEVESILNELAQLESESEETASSE